MHVVGLISDTHGLLRPEVIKLLAGVDSIVHAGDIGGQAVLDQLRNIAPVRAVRGNNDKGAWASGLPESLLLNVEGKQIHVVHDLSLIDIDPAAAGVAVVISGHSHKPTIEQRDRVLYVNPGSAGPKRFRLPIGLARLHVSADKVEAEQLEIRSPR